MFARRLSSAGTALASELQVNSFTTGSQLRPAVAADADGGFVVAWASADQDGSETGVFAQRFAVAAELDIDCNGSVEALTNGPLVRRYEFGFRGAVLITGAVDLGGCAAAAASARVTMAPPEGRCAWTMPGSTARSRIASTAGACAAAARGRRPEPDPEGRA